MDYLLEFKDRMAHAKVLLTDPADDFLLLRDPARSPPHRGYHPFYSVVRDFGIPVGGVVVNGLIQKETVKADSPEFVRNRVKMPGRAHGGDLAGLRRWVRSSFPLRHRDSRAGNAAQAGRQAFRIRKFLLWGDPPGRPTVRLSYLLSIDRPLIFC